MKDDKYTRKRYKAFIQLEKEESTFQVAIISFPEGSGVSVMLRLENEDLTEEELRPLRKSCPVLLKVDTRGGSLDIYKGILRYRVGRQIHLGQVSFVEQLQRRADVKVPMVEVGTIRCLDGGRRSEILPVTFFDISAGGIGFRVEVPGASVEIGDRFQMCFKKSAKPLYVDFEICWASENDDGIFSCGGRFVGMGNWQEAEIRKFVFEVERQEILKQRKVQEILEQMELMEMTDEENENEEENEAKDGGGQ